MLVITLLSAMFLAILCFFLDRKFEQQQRKKEKEQSHKKTLKPLVSEKWHHLLEGHLEKPTTEQAFFDQNEIKPQKIETTATEKKAITLILKPSKGQFFSGRQLKSAFTEIGLIAGSDGFMYKTQGIKTLYSVCHLYQPGTFCFHQLEHTSYSGCLFILCWQDHENLLKIFELMLQDFQRMGRLLHAVCLDENAEPLSLSNISFIRDQISNLKSSQESILT